MRYELKRNSKGMITQCDTNADGGNIYARREEINKQALASLERQTPGKLGNLSNLQVFNFQMTGFDSGSGSYVRKIYNNLNNFPANVTQCVMFGVDGLNNKALYYNVLDIKVNVDSFSGTDRTINTTPDSSVSFFALQNIETSTTSLGTKIPQPAPLFGSGGGALNFVTDGPIYGSQHIMANVGQDSVNIPSNGKGVRCSGLALSKIFLGFSGTEDLASLQLDVYVYVDTSSVSSTY